MKLDRPKLSNQELRKLSLVEGIRYALSARIAEGQSPGPGFAVVGTGKDALNNAHAVITNAKKKRDPDRWLPANTDLSLVFYSHMTGRYIWIKRIERNANAFTIKYQAVPHSTANVTMHFALIPIGKLSPGNFRVKFEELRSEGAAEKAYAPLRDARRIVSDSFSFGVKN